MLAVQTEGKCPTETPRMVGRAADWVREVQNGCGLPPLKAEQTGGRRTLIKRHANVWMSMSTGVSVYPTVKARAVLNRRRWAQLWGSACSF